MHHFVHLTKDEFKLAPGQKIIGADEYLAYREAGDVLKSAREQARHMAEKARKAYEMEEEYGYQDGLEHAKTDVLKQLVSNTEKAIGFLGDLENEVVDVVIAAVEKIIGDFDEAEKVRRVVGKLLQSAKSEQRLTLRVGADSVDTVEATLNDEFRQGPLAIQVIPDSDLSADTFILETSTGIVDGSIATQIDALKAALKARIDGSEEVSGSQ